MRKSLLFVTLTLSLLSSCVREHNIVSVAKQNLPVILDREMQFYMGTVEKPDIKDIMAIYSCEPVSIFE